MRMFLFDININKVLLNIYMEIEMMVFFSGYILFLEKVMMLMLNFLFNLESVVLSSYIMLFNLIDNFVFYLEYESLVEISLIQFLEKFLLFSLRFSLLDVLDFSINDMVLEVVFMLMFSLDLVIQYISVKS